MILLFSDPHITENSIEELEEVFKEIYQVAIQNDKGISHIICLGDYYDKKHPTAKEIEFGTKWIIQFRERFNHFYMLRGNHPTIKDKVSSVEYLKYLGIKVMDELKFGNIFCGHFMCDKSKVFYGYYEKDRKLSDIKAKYIFLGHYHSFQQLDKNAWHLGSVRFVTWNELNDKNKKIAIISKGNQVKFINLKTPIKMKEVSSVSELSNLDSNLKVRIVYKDFNTFKNEVNEINKYKSKFKELKIKLDFERTEKVKETKKTINIQDLIDNWLKNIKDEEVKEILENELKYLFPKENRYFETDNGNTVL